MRIRGRGLGSTYCWLVRYLSRCSARCMSKLSWLRPPVFRRLIVFVIHIIPPCRLETRIEFCLQLYLTQQYPLLFRGTLESQYEFAGRERKIG